jgi:hypothetical protein
LLNFLLNYIYDLYLYIVLAFVEYIFLKIIVTFWFLKEVSPEKNVLFCFSSWSDICLLTTAAVVNVLIIIPASILNSVPLSWCRCSILKSWYLYLLNLIFIFRTAIMWQKSVVLMYGCSSEKCLHFLLTSFDALDWMKIVVRQNGWIWRG